MKINRIMITLFCSFIPALTFVASAILTGLNGLITLIVTSIMYAVIQFYCLKVNSNLELFFRAILSFILGILFVFLILHCGLFYKIFIAVHPDYGNPNAGTGFGVMLSLMLNMFLFIVLVLGSIKTKKAGRN